jgi:hypothetical protein
MQDRIKVIQKLEEALSIIGGLELYQEINISELAPIKSKIREALDNV